MDSLANQYRDNITRNNPNYIAPQISIQSEGWSIWCGPEKLHTPNKETLYDRIYAPKIINFWTNTNYLQPTPRLDPAAASSVDWNAVEALMKVLPAGKQRWSTKHGSENAGGLGATALVWKIQEAAKCPCCPAPEDSAHILRCSSVEFAPAWTEHMETLIQTLEDIDCCPLLKAAIPSRISAWRQEIPYTDDPSWPPQLLALLYSQDTIGWKNLMEGLPSNLWSPYLKTYIASQHYQTLYPPCPNRLLTKILKATHKLAWSQWDYRNQFVNGKGNLRDQAALQLLHSKISSEYITGIHTLPPTDHHLFSECLHSLLSRTPKYKKGWYLNVTSARERQLRRQDMAEEERAAKLANSSIVRWIRTGRLRVPAAH